MFADKHVLITGGSEGLGLALAKLLVSQNARVTLIARTLSKLQAAEAAVVDAVQAAESALGHVDVLICCAGAAELGYFHECDVSLFERQMQLNYMGSVHAAKAVYSSMIARNSGHICFVASTLSLLGLIGYSAYCPSKFALRGLAESLRNEVQGSKVLISISYPADINTPGYARENLSKPWEAAKLSEAAGLQPPHKGLLGLVGPLICHFAASEHDDVARQGASKRFARFWNSGQAAGQGNPMNS
eukprot:gene4465-4721_t